MSQPTIPRIILTTSWDDGHPLDVRIAELLTKHGLSGTFYIPRRNSRGVMPVGDVRNLAKQFEIGAHTLNHIDLTTTSDHTARAEIAGSRPWIEDTTGQACATICFPMGRYRRKHLEFVRDAGYRGARTAELLSTDMPRLKMSVAILPTTLQAYPHNPRTYLRNIMNRGAFQNLPNLIFRARDADWLRTAEEILFHIHQCGGVFHLWGHSWEIDEQQQWRRLEEVFALMGRYKRQALHLTCAQLSEHAYAH